MAITIDYGYVADSESKNLSIPDVDYSNWAMESLKTNSTGKRVEREDVNVTSPLDRQARMRTWRSRIDDIYASSRINDIYQSPIKEGVQIGHTVSTTVAITDTECTCANPIYVPLSATISVVTGLNPNIGVDAIERILKECIGTMFPTGSVSTDQLAKWLAGSLTYAAANGGNENPFLTDPEG